MSVHRPIAVLAFVVAVLAAWPQPPAAAVGTWTWPVSGPVVRGFDPPDSPFGAGHRGIDIAAAVGSVALAPADGRVTFAGPVGGRLFLTIDHGDGVESTLSWVSSITVRKGDPVSQGQPVARTGAGHAGDPISTLHLGVRLDDVYVDPLDYLEAPDLRAMIRLAPVDG